MCQLTFSTTCVASEIRCTTLLHFTATRAKRIYEVQSHQATQHHRKLQGTLSNKSHTLKHKQQKSERYIIFPLRLSTKTLLTLCAFSHWCCEQYPRLHAQGGLSFRLSMTNQIVKQERVGVIWGYKKIKFHVVRIYLSNPLKSHIIQLFNYHRYQTIHHHIKLSCQHNLFFFSSLDHRIWLLLEHYYSIYHLPRELLFHFL